MTILLRFISSAICLAVAPIFATDYDGQRRAERIFQTLILVFAGVGLVCGYFTQQFSHTVYILGGGFVMSCLLTLPPWPMYRMKPLKWQKPREETQEVQKTIKKKK